MGGCAHYVPINPTADTSSSATLVPLAVGIVIAPEFRSYRYVVPLGFGETNVYPLGKPSADLLEAAFPRVFAKTVILSSRGDAERNATQLDALIEPEIARFYDNTTCYLGRMPGGKVFIEYKFTLYAAKGDRIGSWTASGAGSSRIIPRGFSSSYACAGAAVDNAIRNAVSEIPSSMRDVPAVREWLNKAERGR